jgi:hypothetical protein
VISQAARVDVLVFEGHLYDTYNDLGEPTTPFTHGGGCGVSSVGLPLHALPLARITAGRPWDQSKI